MRGGKLLKILHCNFDPKVGYIYKFENWPSKEAFIIKIF